MWLYWLDTVCPWGILPQYRWLRLERMDGHLANCSKNHSCYPYKCEEDDDKAPRAPILPARVLSVGTKPQDIRLLEGGNSHGQYICLSHCWGSEQPLTTTRDNLQDHLVSIPWDKIPILYQDTIRLAWRYQIEFVWIDSLCVLQGDDEDWAREAGRMCDVYGNAWLTVAATSIRGCHESILNNPLDADTADSFLPSQRMIHWEGKYGAARGLHWVVLPQSVQSLVCRYFKLESGEQETLFQETWPLLTRAWAFQERILSPRVMHFATPELWLECREEVCCERSWRLDPGPSQIGLGRRVQETLLEGGPIELEVQWQSLVEEYTRLLLTKEQDRLPALSGLAERFSQAMGSDPEYLAGLWRPSFPEGWAWYKVSTTEETSESRIIRRMMPSWSWAAVSGPVKFLTKQGPVESPSTLPCKLGSSTHIIKSAGIYEHYSKIVMAECLPMMKENPKGRVSRGALRIKGPVIDVVGSWCPCSLGLKHISEEWLGYTKSWCDDSQWFQDPSGVDPVRCCLLWLYGQDRKPGKDTPVLSRAFALVLQAVDSGESTYRRVGLIEAAASKGPGPLDLHGTRITEVTIV